MSDFVGYGVTRNGKPCGLWPQSLEWCEATKERLELKEPGNKFDVVPVFMGAPVPKPVQLPGINKGDVA